jgi:hypothetical protein
MLTRVYRWRFAARLPFSDADHSDNWDIWDTPQITILPYTPRQQNQTRKAI